VTVVALAVAAMVAVVVPRALRAHEARRQAFLGSFDRPPTLGVTAPDAPGPSPLPTPAQRRRRHLRRLLTAMALTGVLGLMPPLRPLLALHLLLDDAFLAYVALLAHRADRRARLAQPVPVTAPAAVRAWRWAFRRPGGRLEGRPVLPDLPPIAPVG
jgi:hypothetical protein